jgi:3-oxoacyl-[acyl-carrier protein] reductase
MKLGIDGKVAVVTASSRGLGKATVQALLGEGVKVVAVARNKMDLVALEASKQAECTALAGDLLDPETPQRAIDLAIKTYGRVDILVANTPGPPAIQPLEATDADFQRAFEATFFPAVRLIRAVIPPMSQSRWGRILIVSSTSVIGPKPFLSLSAAARSALWAWAKSAAPELFESGITINALFAGPHATDRVRQLGASPKVMGLPDDFGAFVASICGESTRFITGTGYVLDGGEFKGI